MSITARDKYNQRTARRHLESARYNLRKANELVAHPATEAMLAAIDGMMSVIPAPDPSERPVPAKLDFGLGKMT